MDRRRVVEVLGTRSGSGLLLADRLVLTAAHLLVPAGRVLADERAAGEVAVRLGDGGDRYAARCVWARHEGPDRGLDAALLEITGPGWRPVAGSVVRLGRLAGSAEARVHAFGFPDATVQADVPELSPVTGTVHTDSGARSGRPEIVIDGEPERGPGGASLWAGLSGGPVFAAPDGVTSDVLLGVIVGDPAGFASRRLRMVPAPAVLADSAAAAIMQRHCGSLAVISFPEPRSPTQPGVRFSLPPDTAVFTGRGEELGRITAAVAGAPGAGGVVVVGAIDGMPGVGKTALAVHVAHELSGRFPDRQLFINLHAHTPGREPVAPQDALAGLLTATGVDPRFVPADLDRRAAMWRDRMAGQRVLLVLDNAASSAQVGPLLPGGGTCLVLVTSRRHLGDLPGAVTPVLLDVLPAEQAEEMFTRLAPRAIADRVGVAEVVRLAGFLPLAVSLLARVFARHPAWTLADLAAETRDSLLTLTAEHQSIAAAFEVSYQHLDPTLRQFFRLLGLHPGTTTDRYAAAALAGISPGEAGRLLDALHGEGLLTETGHRRYGMHDLVRRYVQDRAAGGSVISPGAGLDSLMDYYQHTAAIAEDYLARQIRTRPVSAQPAVPPAAVPDLADRAQALTWAQSERDNVLACIDHAGGDGQYARVADLTAVIAGVLRLDGPWAYAIARHADAARAAEHLGDKLRRANALSDLGFMQYLTGDHSAAAGTLNDALGIYRHLGDRRGQANALLDLGIVHWQTGDNTTAAGTLNDALGIYRDLGDRRGQANTLSELGSVQYQTANYQSADGNLGAALDIYRDLAERRGQTVVLAKLGILQYLTGGYQNAAQLLGTALDISRELGDRLAQANTLNWLGAVHRQIGNYPAAADVLRAALTIYGDLGNRQGQANALTELGAVLQRVGDDTGAAEALESALDSYRSLRDLLGQANALNYIGSLRRRTGDLSAATTALETALSIYRDSGDRGGEAEVLNELGTVHRLSGDLDRATARHREAMELARRINSASDEAYALAGLGRCALAVGRLLEAKTSLARALEIFQEEGADEANSVAAELEALTEIGSAGLRS